MQSTCQIMAAAVLLAAVGLPSGPCSAATMQPDRPVLHVGGQHCHVPPSSAQNFLMTGSMAGNLACPLRVIYETR